MAPCPEHMLNETIAWRGRPDLSKAALDRGLTALISATTFFIGYSTALIILDNQHSFSHRFFPVIVTTMSYFVVFFLVSFVPLLFYEYTITQHYIVVRKWRNQAAYPLHQIKEIKFVGQFLRWFSFSMCLDIRVNRVVSQEKESALWIPEEDRIRIEYPEDPHMVKLTIEGAMHQR
jgi:hypothetical protein